MCVPKERSTAAGSARGRSGSARHRGADCAIERGSHYEIAPPVYEWRSARFAVLARISERFVGMGGGAARLAAVIKASRLTRQSRVSAQRAATPRAHRCEWRPRVGWLVPATADLARPAVRRHEIEASARASPSSPPVVLQRARTANRSCSSRFEPGAARALRPLARRKWRSRDVVDAYVRRRVPCRSSNWM